MTRDEMMIEKLERLQPFGACASYRSPSGPRSCGSDANDCAECLRPESDHEDRQELAAVIAALRAPAPPTLVALVDDVLACAWQLDNKPHLLFSALRRLAVAMPNDATATTVRLLDEARDRAHLLLSPAPAPVAPPSNVAEWIASQDSTPLPHLGNRADLYLAAPPAVAGGDAHCPYCYGSGTCTTVQGPEVCSGCHGTGRQQEGQ